MGKHEKRVYLEVIRKRYRRARRTDKSKILDEFCSVCGYQRKYAIRLLGSKPARSPRRPGRPSQYNHPALVTVMRRIWLATDQMCSKRLVAAMPLWLPHYEMRFGALDDSTRSKLTGISPASIETAQAGADATSQGLVRHQARHAAQESDSDSHDALGYHAARLHGGGYGGALWQFSSG